MSKKMDAEVGAIMEIDPENDNLPAVAEKLKVETSHNSDNVTLTEKCLKYLNGDRDEEGNTLLVRFTKLGKADIVELLLRCNGLDSEDKDNAADIAWREGKFDCLLKLLQRDAQFPESMDEMEVDNRGLKEFIDQREQLHKSIEEGDLDSVIRLTKHQKPSKYLSTTNQSALAKAAECDQFKCYVFLFNHGAKYKDESEEMEMEIDEEILPKFNDLLDDYNLKSEKSCVYKLMHRSHSPQGFNDKAWEKIKSIYHDLYQSEIVNFLMKVLEYESLDIYYDFYSDNINRIHCMNQSGIFGLTLTKPKKIYIGAEKLMSGESSRAAVKGVLAEELCHMAMDVLYKNYANPYRQEDETTEKVQKFKEILFSIKKKCDEESGDIDPVVMDVFKYKRNTWESELIARVPHVLGLYGDEEGRKVLNDCKELSELLSFYEDNVFPKCKSHSHPLFFKKPLCLIESLHNYHGCILPEEKHTPPLKENFKSFKDYLVKVDGMFVISTNNKKLCSLQVYHELKKEYTFQMDKQCLFFKEECFQDNYQDIINAFNCKVCCYLILVTRREMIGLKAISTDLRDDVASLKDGNGGKNVILISDYQGLGPKFKNKRIEYKWNNLSKDYKIHCLNHTLRFNGKEISLINLVDDESISKVIGPEEMYRWVNGEVFKIGNGTKLNSQGYSPHCYVGREFEQITVNLTVFGGLPVGTSLYVTGLDENDFRRLSINEEWVQKLKGPREEIDPNKWIFLKESEGAMTFDDFLHKSQTKKNFWLQYANNMFHLRNADCDMKLIKAHINSVAYSESELLDISNERVVLISDDAGTGKSTVISSIIRDICENCSDSWVGRIDLTDYCLHKDNPLSLLHINKNTKDEDVLNLVLLMIGLKTSLLRHLFKQFIKPDGLKRKFRIFFDGYDEITSLYKENVLKIFTILMKETSIQLWITTRKQEQVELEEKFKICSYSLKRLSDETQVKFLDRMWKTNLKSLKEIVETENACMRTIETIEEKIKEILKKNKNKTFLEENENEDTLEESIEYKDPIFVQLAFVINEEDDCETYMESLSALRLRIDKLDFTSFAVKILQKCSVNDVWMTFMGIPLHIFMVGTVAYDKGLSTEFQLDLHGLYSEFVEGKIRIFLKEKRKLGYDTVWLDMLTKYGDEVLEFHMKIAKQLMEMGKVSPTLTMDPKEVKMCNEIGLTVVRGECIQFLHRTFAEFFYAESVRKNMEKKALMNVIFELKYLGVRTFLSSALDKGEYKWSEKFFQDMDIGHFFTTLTKKSHLRDQESLEVFRKLLEGFEKVSDQKLVNDFIARLNRSLENKRYNRIMDFKTFSLLNVCLTQNMSSKLFGTYIKTSSNMIFDLVRTNDREQVMKALKFLKESVCWSIKGESTNESETSPNENRRPEDEELDEGFVKLFKIRDKSLSGILHHAARNPREGVFVQVLAFSEGILGRELLKRHLLERDGNGCSVLHCHATSGSMDISNIIVAMQPFLEDDFKVLLKVPDINGQSFLHHAAAKCLFRGFEELLRTLTENFGMKIVTEMVLQGDGNGRTVIHHIFESRASGFWEEALQEISKCLDDQDMKELLMRSDGKLETLFHARARNVAGDPPYFLDSYLQKDEIGELLMKRNTSGETVLHVSAYNEADPSQFKRDFPYMFELLGTRFRELILTTDIQGRTFLHLLDFNTTLFFDEESYIQGVKEMLPDDLFQELITIQDGNGRILPSLIRYVEIKENV